MNNQNTIYIDVPKDMSNYLESLMYETNARQDVISYMIDHGMNSSEAFERYHAEYVEYYVKYNTAKHELESRYITSLNLGKVSWVMNFHTNQLEVKEIKHE